MDKEALFRPRLVEDQVDIPGVGTVRVRALSRVEAMMVEGVKEPLARDRKIIALGVIEPELTEAEAGRWQRVAPAGELEPVTVRIAQLSGMMPDSAKETYKSDGLGPVDGVRALSGDEAVPDGGRAPGEPEQ